MARRRKRIGKLSLVTFIALLCSLILASREAWTVLIVLWLFALVLWVAFFKQTQCDVETAAGRGCGNPAHGRLRACHLVKHKRAKHDALWAMVNLRNPAMRYRIKWAQPRSSYGIESPQIEEATPHLMRPVYDGTMLAATILVAIAAITTLALQIGSLT
jgi:Ca2+/Na+ antiporter